MKASIMQHRVLQKAEQSVLLTVEALTLCAIKGGFSSTTTTSHTAIRSTFICQPT